MWSPFFVQTHFQQFSREGKTKGGIPFDTWQVLHKEDLGNFSRRGKQHDRAGSQGGQLAGLVVSFWGETMVSPRNFVDSVFRWVLQGAWQLESFVGVYISSKQILQKTTDKSWFTCFFFPCLHVCYVWMCVCVYVFCVWILSWAFIAPKNWPNSVAQSWWLLVKVISSETIRCLGGKFREAVFCRAGWQNWTLRTWLGSSNTVFYGRGCNIKTWPCF